MQAKDSRECCDAEFAKFLVAEVGDIELDPSFKAALKRCWDVAWLGGFKWGYDYAAEVTLKAISDLKNWG